MAFDRTKFGGGINPSSIHFTVFVYRSDVDDLATISSAGYFAELNDGKERPGQIMFMNDWVLIEGTDGFAIGIVNPGSTDVTLWKTEV